MNNKILVACPTYSGKDYVLDAYLEHFNNFTYKDKSLFIVDNSKDNYITKLKNKKIDCIHVDVAGDINNIIALSWAEIIKKAVDEKYKYVFSCEIDNINPPETIQVLLNCAEQYNAGIVSHDYPDMSSENPYAKMSGLGCTLININFLIHYPLQYKIGKLFKDSNTYYGFDGYIYEIMKRLGKPIIQLSNILDTRHIKINQTHG